MIFVLATIKQGEHVYFVETVKLFEGANERSPISFRVRRNTPSAIGLEELIGSNVTAFWHGPTPAPVGQGRYFAAGVPREIVFNGLIVKQGEFRP